MNKKTIHNKISLGENEQVVKLVRQSFRSLIPKIFLPLLTIILAFFLMFPLFYWGTVGMIIFFVLVLVGFLALLKTILRWYLTVFIITNQKIIDVDQQGLFSKTVSEIEINKIQDVIYRIKGFGQVLARVGNIYVSIADSKSKIVAQNIAQPHKIQQLILQLRSEAVKEKLETGQLSAEELVNLVKKIKSEIGEEKFKEIVESSQGPTENN